jgi:hypothetical protein
MNNSEMMKYLLVTLEEVVKGSFTPQIAAEEIMSAIFEREKEARRTHEKLARKRAS